jgi:hypothetical protein
VSGGVIGRFVVAGLLSTLTMDLGAGLFRKLGFTAGVPLEALAKWFGHLFQGTLTHANVMQASEVKGGLPLAMGCHYLIGVTLTGAFWLLLRQLNTSLSLPMLAAAAIGFGLLTNVFPWLLMFPSMGFGLFGKDGPPEFLLFRSSLLNHVFFGVGVFWTAVVFAPKR